jgi:hypothetical protein
MKNLRLIAVVLGALSSIIGPVHADNLTATFSSTGFNGQYDIIVWIENSVSAFVKTVAAWGGDRTDVSPWSSVSRSTVDATTSATLSGTKSLSATWNGTDVNKAAVANGSYYLCISGGPNNGPFPLSKSPFTFDGTSKTVAGVSTTNFTGISIKITGTGGGTVYPPTITSATALTCTTGTTKTYTATATDPAGKTITFTFTNSPSGALPSWISASGAALTLKPTVAQNAAVKIIASNGSANDTNNLAITVVATSPPVNVPPVFTNPDTTSARIGLTTTWTAHATDANGDAVTFTFTGQASWVAVSGATLTMNPTATSKNDTVRVIASDGKGGIDTLNLKIAVLPALTVNVPPVFTNPDTISVPIGKATIWTALATDANGDAVTYRFSGQPSWTSVSNAVLTMNPTSASQNTVVRVIASDNKGGLDTLDLKITVFTPPGTNAPPKITSPDTVSARIGSITKWIAYATDPNGDPVSISFKGLPTTPTAWYSFSQDTLIIIPEQGSPNSTVTVIASDGKGGIDSIRLRITVLPSANAVKRDGLYWTNVKKNFTLMISNTPCSVPLAGDGAVAITLFSCNGAKIIERVVNAPDAENVAFRGVKKGVYLLSIKIQGAAFARKIIIDR